MYDYHLKKLFIENTISYGKNPNDNEITSIKYSNNGVYKKA